MALTIIGLCTLLLVVQAPANPQNAPPLQAQAETGDPAAQLNLARAYERGDGVARDEQKAAEWYRKAAEAGNAVAQNRLGEMYRSGEGVKENKQAAVEWYHKSARHGNADAMCNLGAAYYNGDGADTDDSLSYAWFTLAKRAGCERAAEAVERAESQLRPSAITQGIKRIAEMYDRGEFLPENQVEAAAWWLRAAERGDPDARLAYATKLINGQGVAQDLEQGHALCSKAVKEGDSRGDYCMGYLYQRGLGVTLNTKKARNWYERGATRGNPGAIKALAQMEVAGEGGKVDRLKACLLYAALAAAGDKDALRSLARLKKEVSANDWSKIEKQLPEMRVDPAKLDSALLQVDAQ